MHRTCKEQGIADHFSLLLRTVQDLDSNTSASRQAIYDRARRVIEESLRSRTPSPSDAELGEERQALEYAIWRVEMENADHGTTRIALSPADDPPIGSHGLRYVQSIPQPGEQILARGKFHWIV